MDLEKKIWAASSVLFLTVGISALGHTAWLVCTAVALLLGGLFLVRGFPPVPNVGPAIATNSDGLGMMATFLFLYPLSILQKDNPHVPLFVLMCAASLFCVLMMVRPVATDFGVLNGLGYLTVFLASDEFGTGWQTWLCSTLFTLMTILRYILEMRARRD